MTRLSVSYKLRSYWRACRSNQILCDRSFVNRCSETNDFANTDQQHRDRVTTTNSVCSLAKIIGKAVGVVRFDQRHAATIHCLNRLPNFATFCVVWLIAKTTAKDWKRLWNIHGNAYRPQWQKSEDITNKVRESSNNGNRVSANAACCRRDSEPIIIGSKRTSLKRSWKMCAR